jgi:hypothetical protein
VIKQLVALEKLPAHLVQRAVPRQDVVLNSQVRATFGRAMPPRLKVLAIFSKTCVACWSRGDIRGADITEYAVACVTAFSARATDATGLL